jgi:hypothetical protein
MMNVPVEILKQTVDGLKSTPALLLVILLNIVMLAGFVWTLSSIASALERRDAMIKSCIEGRA